MVYPSSWTQTLNQQKNGVNKTEDGRKLRIGGIKFRFWGTKKEDSYDIKEDKVKVVGLDPKVAKFKINFNDPFKVSLTDANEMDKLEVIIDAPLKGKNGLDMDTEGFK